MQAPRISNVILLSALAAPVVALVGLVGIVVFRGGQDVALSSEEAEAQAPAPLKPTSLDADKDGWLDIDDPLPNSLNNLDNDALANNKDPDDDNDGILDTADKYPLDQNNNKTTDAAERRIKGERFDGDKDGRPDLGELRKVALAEAEKLGLQLSTSVLHLTDIPRQVFRSLPQGWNFVCQDTDNDGNPNPTDPFDLSFGGSYNKYTHDGAFEKNFVRYEEEWKKHGFVSTGVAGILGEPPRFEVPSAWAKYVPGSTPAGGDPHASFYGHVPTSEHGQYYVPSGQTAVPGPGGTIIYQPPASGTTTGGTSTGTYSGGTEGGHTYTETMPPPPPPPAGEPPPPPPPPPPSH